MKRLIDQEDDESLPYWSGVPSTTPHAQAGILYGDSAPVPGWADGQRQLNFERQAGGHGSIGGEQDRPFLLVKREWGVSVEGVEDAAGLHPVLWDLRLRFA